MGLARDRDIWSGVVLALLGVFVLREALQWTYLGDDGPGPGFFPVWYGVILIALSLYQIAKAVWKPDPAARADADWAGTARALGTWVAFALSIALVEPLGFFVSFALLSIVIITGVLGKPIGTALVTSITMSAAFYAVFSYLLGLNLPTGSAWTPLLRITGLG